MSSKWNFQISNSYFSTTIIPPTSTVYIYTSTVVGNPSATPPPGTPTTVAPATILAWAQSACDTPVAQSFSSACSCAGVTAATTTAPSPVATVTTVQTLLPTGECVPDYPPPNRDFSTMIAADNSVTPETCHSMCGSAGYAYYGVQYYNQCFCGSAIAPGTEIAPYAASGCNAPCNANSAETCGGTWFMNVYTI